MWDFLQAYGAWIVFGVLFLLMMRMHGGGSGSGCGMGHGQHHSQDERRRSTHSSHGELAPPDESPADARRDDVKEKTPLAAIREVAIDLRGPRRHPGDCWAPMSLFLAARAAWRVSSSAGKESER